MQIWKKKSLKNRLLTAFLITSLIPIIISGLLSYYNSSKIVKQNMDELTKTNLNQTGNSLGIWLESYEDLLYQIYTDDDLIAQVEKLNSGEDVAVTVNQVRRKLRGLLNTKNYVRSISIITENGKIITYNTLSGVSSENNFFENYSSSMTGLYRQISSDSKTHVLRTQFAATFASKDYYLFHLAHRLINYKNLEQQTGIVMVSIDEQLLEQVCQNKNMEKNNVEDANFIIDKDGYIVAFPDQEMIGKKIPVTGKSFSEIETQIKKFVDSARLFQTPCSTVFTIQDEERNWNIIHVSSRNEVLEKLRIQGNFQMITTLLSLGVVIFIVIILTEQLTGSIRKVVSVMEKAGTGDLTVRIHTDKKMPVEVESIANQFNFTMAELKQAGEKEREAVEKQKNAEIRALEAQINPHFLYNTLDTINWMAIDKDEYEISNAITSLAHILRYAIANSNGIVTVREEVEWLKNYIFLQQTRVKNSFRCNIHVDPELYEFQIHKLLLQPFIENAIIHGFEGVKGEKNLSISINREADKIHITIEDNGKGIDAEVLERMNRGSFEKSKEKSHIGMENAMTRLKMYYGNQAEVTIGPGENSGTRIRISLETAQQYQDNDEVGGGQT